MSTILRSIAGRLFGLDANGYATSPNGIKAPDIKVGTADSELSIYGANAITTASTGSTIGQAGYTSLANTTAAAFTLAAPTLIGVPKQLHSSSSSTGQTVTLVSGTFSSTAGSSQNRATFIAGTAMSLIAISTAKYAVVANAGVSFSTA
jgi:hypothetical protein